MLSGPDPSRILQLHYAVDTTNYSTPWLVTSSDLWHAACFDGSLRPTLAMMTSCPELPDLLEGIYFGISEPEAVTSSLLRFAQIAGAQFSTFAVPTPDFEAFDETRMVGDFDEGKREKLRQFECENPRSNTVLRFSRLHPDAGWFDTHESLPASLRDSDPFLRFTASEIGTPRWCAAFLPSRYGLGMGIALNYRRPENATPRNAGLQRTLFRHLVLAHRLALRSPLLEAETDPVLLLDGFGRVIYCNPAAEAELGSPHPAFAVRFRRLRLPDPPLQSQLDAMVADACAALETGWSGGTLLLRHDGPARYRLLRVSPLPGQFSQFGNLAARVIVRLFPACKSDADSCHALLRNNFGLTATEASFAHSFLTNDGNIRAVAADLQIRYNTARVHLYRIFDKTGARTQAQLLLLLERLARAR